MSMHERVFEGTLHWPIAAGALICQAGQGQQYPHVLMVDPARQEQCGQVIAPGRRPHAIADLISALETHMRDVHGERI